MVKTFWSNSVDAKEQIFRNTARQYFQYVRENVEKRMFPENVSSELERQNPTNLDSKSNEKEVAYLSQQERPLAPESTKFGEGTDRPLEDLLRHYDERYETDVQIKTGPEEGKYAIVTAKVKGNEYHCYRNEFALDHGTIREIDNFQHPPLQRELDTSWLDERKEKGAFDNAATPLDKDGNALTGRANDPLKTHEILCCQTVIAADHLQVDLHSLPQKLKSIEAHNIVNLETVYFVKSLEKTNGSATINYGDENYEKAEKNALVIRSNIHGVKKILPNKIVTSIEIIEGSNEAEVERITFSIGDKPNTEESR